MLVKRSLIIMGNTKRRTFLRASIASFPLALLGQVDQGSTHPAGIRVPAGADRLGEHHTLGVSSTDFKLVTRDTRGGMFVMEHMSRKKGGPPRHMHQKEDEWFYVIEGDYIVEVGTERFRLKSGDSVLGPRQIPHTWAFAGDTPGKLLIAFAPANKMEAYFRAFEPRAGAYSKWDDPDDIKLARAHGIELLGPPLPVE
jgi:mannose-6-phosphate isomerase-like protein (cupin superfamily)